MTEMYGGKIDDEQDFAALNALIEAIMTPRAFDDEYDIVRDIQIAGQGKATDSLILSSGTGWKEFMEWVNSLPEREPPTYLGLPANAEKLLLEGQAKKMVHDLKDILKMLDEGDQLMAEADD